MKKEHVCYGYCTQCHRRWKEAIEHPSNEKLREVLCKGATQGGNKSKKGGEQIDWSAAPFIRKWNPEKRANTIEGYDNCPM